MSNRADPCAEYTAWLLTSPEAEEPAPPARLASHAASCVRCGGQADWFADVERALSSEPPAAAPPGLAAATLRRLAAEPDRGLAPAAPWTVLVAAAALLVVSIVGGLAATWSLRWLPPLEVETGWSDWSDAVRTPPVRAEDLRDPVLRPGLEDLAPGIEEALAALSGRSLAPLAALAGLLWLAAHAWLLGLRRRGGRA